MTPQQAVVVAAPPAVDVVHQPGVFVVDGKIESDNDGGWQEGGESEIDSCEGEIDRSCKVAGFVQTQIRIIVVSSNSLIRPHVLGSGQLVTAC